MSLLFPQAALAAGVVGALGLGLVRRPPAAAVRALALAAPLAALYLLQFSASAAPAALPPLVAIDLKSLAWQLAIYVGAVPLAVAASGDDVEAALFLGATLGMGLLAVAASLPMLFVSLEFMSLPAYLLVARAGGGDRARRLEAAVKYFFAGALAGALFLMGLALYYSETRGLSASSAALGARGQAGLALMAAAALFKLGAVPLHWWLPDVYEAAAPEVSGFLSTSMKAAAVLFLMRVVQLSAAPAFAAYLPGIGAFTALVGAVLALKQERLQRLLAYSSLAHAGLLILGVGAWARTRDAQGAAALVFYLGAYAFMSNGAFLFLKATGLKTRAGLRGLAAREPALAAAFAVLLFSLGGIPPTGGFVAKLLVFWQALSARLVWPALLGAVSALVSLGYYLGLIRDLYFESGEGAAAEVPDGERARWTVFACAAGALALGAAPLFLRGLSGGLWR